MLDCFAYIVLCLVCFKSISNEKWIEQWIWELIHVLPNN